MRRLLVVFLLIIFVCSAYSQTSEERSLRPAINDFVYRDGWLYICIAEPNVQHRYMLCRIKLSDLKTETIYRNGPHITLVAVVNDFLFSRSNGGLYKQSIIDVKKNPINNNKEIHLKKDKSNRNSIDNVILFNNRIYYSQPIDTIADNSKAVYNICSMNIDGSDDKKLTGRYYNKNFCIYKGMIFARNYNSAEIEKLDIKGNQIDNYGNIGYGYFDVYNDCIYYLDNDYSHEISTLYKIDTNTKKKQLIKGNPFIILNPVISNNHLIFNTKKQYLQRSGSSYNIASLGDLYSINLESGERKNICPERLCALYDVYNGIIYCKEFVDGNIREFQINIDGTDEKAVKLFW